MSLIDDRERDLNEVWGAPKKDPERDVEINKINNVLDLLIDYLNSIINIETHIYDGDDMYL